MSLSSHSFMDHIKVPQQKLVTNTYGRVTEWCDPQLSWCPADRHQRSVHSWHVTEGTYVMPKGTLLFHGTLTNFTNLGVLPNPGSFFAPHYHASFAIVTEKDNEMKRDPEGGELKQPCVMVFSTTQDLELSSEGRTIDAALIFDYQVARRCKRRPKPDRGASIQENCGFKERYRDASVEEKRQAVVKWSAAVFGNSIGMTGAPTCKWVDKVYEVRLGAAGIAALELIETWHVDIAVLRERANEQGWDPLGGGAVVLKEKSSGTLRCAEETGEFHQVLALLRMLALETTQLSGLLSTVSESLALAAESTLEQAREALFTENLDVLSSLLVLPVERMKTDCSISAESLRDALKKCHGDYHLAFMILLHNSPACCMKTYLEDIMECYKGKADVSGCGQEESSQIIGTGRALGHFNGSEYGCEYLSLAIGDQIEVQRLDGDDARWAFGCHPRVQGWFPTSYVLRGKAVATFEGKDYGEEYLSLSPGDLVELHRLDPLDDRWAYGERSKKEGWFPTEHVRVDGMGKALGCFDGKEYGEAYLTLTEGDWLKVDMARGSKRGWIFAEHLTRRVKTPAVSNGWISEAYWEQW